MGTSLMLPVLALPQAQPHSHHSPLTPQSPTGGHVSTQLLLDPLPALPLTHTHKLQRRQPGIWPPVYRLCLALFPLWEHGAVPWVHPASKIAILESPTEPQTTFSGTLVGFEKDPGEAGMDIRPLP